MLYKNPENYLNLITDIKNSIYIKPFKLPANIFFHFT